MDAVLGCNLRSGGWGEALTPEKRFGG
jgi:hypothetical protein